MTYGNPNLVVLTADHLDGVRSRRVFAFLFDLIFIGLVSLVAFFVVLMLGFLTFGLSWLLIPVLMPVVAFFYNGLTLSGSKRSTWGMRMMDLEVRMIEGGGRVPFINAALHAVLFYVSWVMTSGLIVLISLLTRDKRCLHDMLAGIIVMRSSH